jgi:hypothetical protein
VCVCVTVLYHLFINTHFLSNIHSHYAPQTTTHVHNHTHTQAYDAQEFAQSISPELGMDTVPSLNLVYTAEEEYVTADEAAEKGRLCVSE